MDYTLVTAYDTYSEFMEDLLESDQISVDTETDSLDPFDMTPLLLQIKVSNRIYIFDCRKLQGRLINYVIELIKDSNKLCLFHNAKFDLKVIKKLTGTMLINVYDTMLAEILLYQGLGRDYPSYAELAKTYCNVEVSKEERSSFAGFSGEITNEMLEYSAIDVEHLDAIRIKQLELIKKSGQERVLELENNLVSVVADMELTGVLLDVEYWKELEKTAIEYEGQFRQQVIDEIFARLKIDVYSNPLQLADALAVPVKAKRDRTALEGLDMSYGVDWIKEKFNVGSPIQMRTVLNLIGVPVPNTSEKTLARFKNRSPVIELLLGFREHQKKISTYGSKYLENIHPKTGRIHSNLEQLGTYTGRFSSDSPNLQNIPKEQAYRRAFIARPGYKIIAVDYSQQEFRLAGAVSRDPVIINAYKVGKDMHIAAGAILYDISLDEVKKQERSDGKTFNFAAIYGTSKWGLARNLKIELDDAEKKLDKYWAGFPVLAQVKTWFEDKIFKNLYASTLLGRKRYFNEKTLFENYGDRERYEASIKREGWNLMIQGSAADITKQAMIDIYRKNPYGDDLKLLLQVHDELLIEVKDEIVDKAIPFVVQCMKDAEQPYLGEIPAEVEYAVNDYWVH